MRIEETPANEASGVILAGGLSKRFGREKSQELWDGKRLIEHVDRSFPSCVSDRITVLRPDQDLSNFSDFKIAFDDQDLPPCPLRGVIAGLESARFKQAIVVACDTPLVRLELWEMLINIQSREFLRGSLLTVPMWKGRLNPLLACFSVSAAKLLRQELLSGQRSIYKVIRNIPHTLVSEEECRQVDPLGHSFLNVNTPEDFNQLQQTDRL